MSDELITVEDGRHEMMNVGGHSALDPIHFRDTYNLDRVMNSFIIKKIYEESKKYGKKIDKNGTEFYQYNVTIPKVHEDIKLNSGKNVIFLVSESEKTIYCFYDKESFSELEAEVKKILSKYKTTVKKGEEEHPILKVGTIMVSSWGYDQTNIDFYVVVRSNAKTAWINEINSIKNYTGNMSGTAMPDTKNMNMKIGPKTLRKKIDNFGSDPSISLNSFSSAYVWDGKPENYTSYA
jgi:hypothetical protein